MERRQLQEENEQLRNQLAQLQQEKSSDSFDRDKFYEGACWMAHQWVDDS